MAVGYTIGFESNTYEGAATTGTTTIDATSKISGTYSLKIDCANGNSYISLSTVGNPISGSGYYFHMKFLSADLANTPYLARGYDTGAGAVVWQLEVVASGGNRVLRIHIVSGTDEYADGTTALANNTAYRVEVYFNRDLAGKGYAEGKLNGVSEASKTHSTGTAATGENLDMGYLQKIGAPSALIYFADIYLESTAWPGNLTFLYKRPAGESATYDTWAGVGDTTNQYLNWDEVISDGDTTYNKSNTGATDGA